MSNVAFGDSLLTIRDGVKQLSGQMHVAVSALKAGQVLDAETLSNLTELDRHVGTLEGALIVLSMKLQGVLGIDWSDLEDAEQEDSRVGDAEELA